MIDFDGAKNGDGLSAQRPGVGMAGFSESLYGDDDAALYKSLKRATAEHVAADELLAGDSNASLDELAGSRATACRIREWQEAHARRSG